MVAGDSAGAESRRQLALADAHEKAAAEARAAAGRFGIAETTERQTARTLAPLSGLGYFLLPDRRWPGTRRAQVDLVVIGPGGVFIVDTKAWKEVGIDKGRVLRGDDDVTDELLRLNDLVDVTQADLAEAGLAPGEVHPLVVLAGRGGLDATVCGIRIVGERDALRAIARHGNRLTPTQVDIVMGRALTLFPQVSAPASVIAAVAEPVVPAATTVDPATLTVDQAALTVDQAAPTVDPAAPTVDPATPTVDPAAPTAHPATEPVDPGLTAPRKHAAEQDALLTPEEINDALLESVLAQPIEEWMSFLHPHQAKLVRRSFPGPSRIRGPAGTGKTVVGLHRAAHLARTRPGRILVTTYVRTLPDVLRELLRRLAPEVVDRVDFVGTHAFARRVLQERGVPHTIDPAKSRDAFNAAWHRVGATSVLGESQDSRYWDEEIQHVLKGRGITRFEDYADLARTGRRHRLPLPGREAVWRLHEAYDAELRRRGVSDYADLILLAEAELKRAPMVGTYSAVIVDEAQDLSCAMIRMLHSLVGDEPDGFTLVGDGQQSIYPGGYTLAEAGISVANRGVVLDINYRNTAQIVSFAQRLVAGDEYADIEGVLARGDVPSSVPRKGADPVIARCRGRRELHEALIARIRSVTTEIGTTVGDVAVLCISRWAARDAAHALEHAGVPVVDLEKYDGVPVEAVKVGTIKRAKGLEFKQVLIPDIRREHTVTDPPADDGVRERWDLTRRELYVAMTRARDGLWVGISS